MEPHTLKILLAADGSPQAAAAATLLTDLRRFDGAQVTVLGVVPQRWSLIGIGLKTREELHDTVARLRRVNYASVRAVASQSAAPLRAAGLAAAVEVREGAPAQAILDLAAELPAGLVALGARGFSPGGELRLGATARRVVRNASSSVLLGRPRRSAGPPRLLLAVDRFTDPAAVRDCLRALSPTDRSWVPEVLVAGLAGMRADADMAAAELLARQSDEEQVELRALELAEEIQDLGFRVRNIFPTGEPRAELIRLAQVGLTDLVVVGPGRSDAHLGGLAWAALKYAPCSVLVARPLPHAYENVGREQGIAAQHPLSLPVAAGR